MSDRLLSASFFRLGSARLLVGGALVCTVLLLAGMHVLAAVGMLLVIAAAGAVQRAKEGTVAGWSKQASLHGGVAQAEGSSPGVADRSMLEARLDAECQREGRAGEPTGLLLIAIDSFDELRVQGCALAGEVAMLTLENTLKRMLPRGADLLARYNDSTFAVMLRGTDLSGSLRVAARLRWAIVRLGIANAQTDSGLLTVCIGVAVQHELTSGGTQTLIAAAEEALHAAQRLGADRLDYVELGTESRAGKPVAAGGEMAAIRAWTQEQAPALYSPQG